MLRYFFVMLYALVLSFSAATQPKTDPLLRQIFAGNTAPALRKVLEDPARFRCQIIYTQIDRSRRNKPSFRNFYFNYDPGLYYYPASTVKLPLAALALEKLNGLSHEGVDKNTTILFDSSYAGQKPLYHDSTAANGLPSIAQFIRRVLLISENDPYNRLYQFVGQQQINRRLHRKGYVRSRITSQFMGFTPEQNRHTNAVRFVGADDRLLYAQPAAYNQDSFNFSPAFLVGKAFYRKDSLIKKPFDFTRHNYLPLEDLQQILQSLMFPQSVSKRQRFRLSADDYRFLHRYLSQYPSETPYPRYNSTVFYDSYVKFFFLDSTHRMPQHVRVFNKVGWAYGFLTDVAYVADFANGVEYMLTATIYVNSDEVLNDDKYEYESVGLPFFRALGQAVYQYELQRPRKREPDLSAFKLVYENRADSEGKPEIKEADN